MAGRVVVLVSHDMAEVEVLATTVGIMTHGRLRCLGDQQHLKLAYGGGYRLQTDFRVEVDEPDDTAAALRVATVVLRLFPGATIDSHFSGFLSFVLPQSVPASVHGAGTDAAALSMSTDSIATPPTAAGAPSTVPLRVSRVFDLMRQHADSAGITDWGLAQVSLDAVFQRIVRHYRGPGVLPEAPGPLTLATVKAGDDEFDDIDDDGDSSDLDGESEVEAAGGDVLEHPPESLLSPSGLQALPAGGRRVASVARLRRLLAS